jgi:choice-of-anchor A domain-containing protein
MTFDGTTVLAAGSGEYWGSVAFGTNLTIVGGGTLASLGSETALPFSFTTVGAALKNASTGWAENAGLPLSISGTTLTLVGTDPQQDIFDVTVAQLEAASTVTIDVPHASPEPTVLINVTGTAAYTSPAGQTFNFTNDGTAQAATTLWNFSGAANVTISDETWEGTIVAPFVTKLTATNGTINGSLIVGGSGAGGALVTGRTTATGSWNTVLNLFAGSCLPSNSGPPALLPEGKPLFLGALGVAALAGTYVITRRRRAPAFVSSN